MLLMFCMTSYLAAQTRTHARGARCVFLFRCDPWPTLQVHVTGSQMGGVCPPSYLSTPCDTTFSPCRVPNGFLSTVCLIKPRCACHNISNEQRHARLCDKWRMTTPLPTSSCNFLWARNKPRLCLGVKETEQSERSLATSSWQRHRGDDIVDTSGRGRGRRGL